MIRCECVGSRSWPRVGFFSSKRQRMKRLHCEAGGERSGLRSGPRSEVRLKVKSKVKG